MYKNVYVNSCCTKIMLNLSCIKNLFLLHKYLKNSLKGLQGQVKIQNPEISATFAKEYGFMKT